MYDKIGYIGNKSYHYIGVIDFLFADVLNSELEVECCILPDQRGNHVVEWDQMCSE